MLGSLIERKQWCEHLSQNEQGDVVDQVLCLKAVLAVADAGSFSEAARRLGVAISVVKKRVDQIEDECHVLLFSRNTRRIVLTDEGRRQLPSIRRAVREIDDAVLGLRHRPSKLDGTIRIKASSTLTALYLGDMLNAFMQDHPSLAIELVIIDRPVNPLIEGFDIAVGVTPGSYHGVTEVALCELERWVVASPAYLARRGEPRAPQELQTHDILLFEPTGKTWTFDGPSGPIAVDVQPRLTCNDGGQLLRAALLGMGIASLSSYIVEPAVRAGTLVCLLPTYRLPMFWVRLLVPEARMRSEAVHTLVTYLGARFAPSPPWRHA